MRGTVLLILFAVAAVPAWAARVRSLSVHDHDGVYVVDMRARLDAKPAEVYAVLTDYRALPRINPAIRSVRVLPPSQGAGGRTRVATVTRACVWFYCKVVHQVQRMTATPPHRVQAVIVPSQSDFRSGHAQWTVERCGQSACLTFHARLQPDFWVPPLIGPWIIQHKLRDEALITARGIERLANSDASRHAGAKR